MGRDPLPDDETIHQADRAPAADGERPPEPTRPAIGCALLALSAAVVLGSICLALGVRPLPAWMSP